MMGYVIVFIVALICALGGVYLALLVSQGDEDLALLKRWIRPLKRKKTAQGSQMTTATKQNVQRKEKEIPLDEQGNPLNPETRRIVTEAADASEWTETESESPLSRIADAPSYSDFCCEAEESDIGESIRTKMRKQDDRYRQHTEG